MQERVTLISVAKGAAPELFERELAVVLNNIQDINTSWKTKREITVRVAFHPNETREKADVILEVTSKLAAVKPVENEVYFGRQDGELIAAQADPKQPGIFDQPDLNIEPLAFNRQREASK